MYVVRKLCNPGRRRASFYSVGTAGFEFNGPMRGCCFIGTYGREATPLVGTGESQPRASGLGVGSPTLVSSPWSV